MDQLTIHQAKLRKNLTGFRFGNLVVLEYAGSIKNFSLWSCRCDCGQTKTVRGCSLKSGGTISCGCLIGRKRIPIELLAWADDGGNALPRKRNRREKQREYRAQPEVRERRLQVRRQGYSKSREKNARCKERQRQRDPMWREKYNKWKEANRDKVNEIQRTYRRNHAVQCHEWDVAKRLRKYNSRIPDGDRIAYRKFIKHVKQAATLRCYWCERKGNDILDSPEI